MPQLQVQIEKHWGCLERSFNAWRTTLTTLWRSRDADPASQGQSQITVPLVMEPHQGDSAGRGGDDARAYGRFEAPPPKDPDRRPRSVTACANLFIGLKSIISFFWFVILQNFLAPAVVMPLRAFAKRCTLLSPLLAAPAALLLSQGQALASTALVTFPLNDNADGNSGFNYSIIDSSVLTAATIANGPGFGTFSVGTEGFTPDVQVLRTGPSSNTFPVSAADALNNNWYFTIALTPNGSMSINTINLDWSRGVTTGVRGWFVRSNLDNFVSDLYSNQTPDGAAKGLQPVSIDLSSFTGLTTPTEFRFYSYTERTGRYIAFSNISFLQADGSGPASVPGPLPLLGVGAAFGWSRRLRKRIAAPLITPSQA